MTTQQTSKEPSLPQVPRAFITSLSAQPAADPSRPKLSVVMPSYNQAAFIERSILSVLNQGYPNLEFIIIDGGSTDGTVAVIQRYASHLAYWISEPDQGQSDALNKGFAKVSGEVVGWLNSDDLYLPGAFAAAIEAFSQHPARQVVYGDWLSIDAQDQTVTLDYAFDFDLGHFKYEGFHLNSQAMFWRREAHSRFGLFDLGLYNTMDYDLILRLGINEGSQAFLRIPRTLACFRRHEAQKTTGTQQSQRVQDEHRRIAQAHGYADKYQTKGRLMRLRYRCRRAYWYLKRGGLAYFFNKLIHGQK